MSPEYLGLVLLVALITCIFIGFPIAFTLIILAVVFGYIGFGKVVFFLMFFQTWQIMKEETLAAVPLFIFMGHILEQAGLMERLFLSFQFILARVKGSLFLGVLFVSTIFATATGIIGASVTVMGLLAGAGHDAQPLQHGPVRRRHHRRRLPRHPHPAQRPPGRAGAGGRGIRGAALRRGDRAGAHPLRPVFRLHVRALPDQSGPRTAAARGRTAGVVLGRDSRVLPGNRAAGGRRFRRFGKHHRRPRHADGSGGHGGAGRPVADAPVRAPELDDVA